FGSFDSQHTVCELRVVEHRRLGLMHRVAGGRDRVPPAAESAEAFAPGLAGPLVAGEVVERVSVVGDLNPTVLTAGRAQKRAAGTGDRPRLAVRGERRPVARAGAIAAARASFVVCRQIERPTVPAAGDP